MEYYANAWADEVEELYIRLQTADVDIVACNEMELQDVIKKYAHHVRNRKHDAIKEEA
jgi:hypothetical protein